MMTTDFNAPGLPRSSTVRHMTNAARWGLTPRQRQAALEFLEGVIDDPTAGTITKIKAVEVMMKADALDLAAQRSSEQVDSGMEPQVLLLLPPNGSERTTA
jgi:hypothetical protein